MSKFLLNLKQALLKESLDENLNQERESSFPQPSEATIAQILPMGNIYGSLSALAALEDDRGLLSKQRRGVSSGSAVARPTRSRPPRTFHATVHDNVELVRNNEFSVTAPCKICGHPGKTCLVCKTAMCDKCYTDTNYDDQKCTCLLQSLIDKVSREREVGAAAVPSSRAPLLNAKGAGKTFRTQHL